MGRPVRWVWLLALVIVAQVAAAPLRVQQVAPGVYVHFGQHKDVEDGYDGDIANIGFIIGRDAVAVIDTGGSYAVGMALKQALRAITALPIRYVINTHGHPDHVFGNAAFIDGAATPGQAPPRLIGHAMLPRALAVRGDAYLRNLKKQLGRQAARSTLLAPTAPTDTVNDRLRLDLGDRPLELRAWPRAHTNQDLTVFDVGTGTLWTGDLLFVERTPAVDGDGDVAGWLAAIEALQTLPATTTIPGHGPVLRNKSRALARQRDYLATLLHDVRASIRQGSSLDETMTTAAASQRKKWQLFEVVNGRNVNVVYPVLEWE
jgi:quinoprotein relay system zinc metallohydrolase 2